MNQLRAECQRHATSHGQKPRPHRQQYQPLAQNPALSFPHTTPSYDTGPAFRQIGCFGTTDPGAAKDGRSGPCGFRTALAGGIEDRHPGTALPVDHASKQGQPVPDIALTRVSGRQARMPDGRKA